MSRARTAAWIVGVAILGAIVALVLINQIRHRKALTLMGAVTVRDADPNKEVPIANVEVTDATSLAVGAVNSDASGFFALKLRRGVRRGHPITLQFRHPNYKPLDLKDYTGDQLYVVHMEPLAREVETLPNQPSVSVANIRVRYSTETIRDVNIGSAVKTFQVINVGNVPCKGHGPCSPNGKWKAGVGSTSLDAGPGNTFRAARVSCIAGPCPFTRIDADHFSDGGRTISVTARDWSDTTTFLFEAEVFHEMPGEAVYESYPVIFGRALNFTVPTGAQGVSIEADIGGTTIIFPLGPALFLSWANCDVRTNPDHTTVYRCQLKRGYRFK